MSIKTSGREPLFPLATVNFKIMVFDASHFASQTSTGIINRYLEILNWTGRLWRHPNIEDIRLIKWNTARLWSGRPCVGPTDVPHTYRDTWQIFRNWCDKRRFGDIFTHFINYTCMLSSTNLMLFRLQIILHWKSYGRKSVYLLLKYKNKCTSLLYSTPL